MVSVNQASIRWIEKTDAEKSDRRYNVAFQAARRALIRCGQFDMPRAKYAQWKDLEVVFNPEGMKGLF